MDIRTITEVLSRASSLILTGSITLIAVLVYLRRGRLKLGSFTLDFDKSLEAEVRLQKHRLFHESNDLDAADRQYLLLKSYHAQSLAQSRLSFWFSLVFASLGFGVIVLALQTSGAVTSGDKVIKLISGTVIDAVAGLFFVQSNKARELMSEFFDKLRTDRKLEESLRLAGSIPDETLKARLQVVLSLNFANVALTDTALQNLLDKPPEVRKSERELAPPEGAVIQIHPAVTAEPRIEAVR